MLGTTEGYFDNSFSFEKSHLGYFLKIFTVLPKEELKEIQKGIHTIGNCIDHIPVERLLKINEHGQWLLGGKTLKRLRRCYIKGQEELKRSFTFFREKKI